MKINDIESFTFFKNYAIALEDLSEKEQKDLLLKMIKFVFYDETPEFKKGTKLSLAWAYLMPILTKSKNKSRSAKK